MSFSRVHCLLSISLALSIGKIGIHFILLFLTTCSSKMRITLRFRQNHLSYPQCFCWFQFLPCHLRALHKSSPQRLGSWTILRHRHRNFFTFNFFIETSQECPISISRIHNIQSIATSHPINIVSVLVAYSLLLLPRWTNHKFELSVSLNIVAIQELFERNLHIAFE